jgi:hypothetical protein
VTGPDDIERRVREIQAELAAAAKRNERPRKPGPEQPRGPQPSTRGRIWSLVAVVVVLAGMAAAAVGIINLARHPPKAPSADNTPVTNGPTPFGQPTATTQSSAPSTSFLPSPTVAAPFLGTPAQSYANGTAGIVIPPAHAVGTYSAAQVAAAYQETKRLLIAANLNPQTLRGGSPDAFASLLIPQQRSFFVDNLDKVGLDSRGYARSTRGWVVSFAPRSTQLVGNVIKVHGSMRAMAAQVNSSPVLRIHADYLFVYAVEQPDNPLTLMRIVAQDVVNVDFGTFTDPGGPLQAYWNLIGGGAAGARCDVNDGFVHPEFPHGPPDKVKPTGAPINPYNPGKSATEHTGCEATTGT